MKLDNFLGSSGERDIMCGSYWTALARVRGVRSTGVGERVDECEVCEELAQSVKRTTFSKAV